MMMTTMDKDTMLLLAYYNDRTVKGRCSF